MPFLNIGTMPCVFRISGISPVSNDFRQIVYIGSASCSLHSLRTMVGSLSGPGAAEFGIDSMALMTSSGVKVMSSKVG